MVGSLIKTVFYSSMRIVCLLLFIYAPSLLWAQQDSSKYFLADNKMGVQKKWFTLNIKTIYLTDSLTPLPNSFTILGSQPKVADSLLKKIQIRYELDKKALTFEHVPSEIESIQISYHVVPFPIGSWLFRRSLDEYERAAEYNFIDTVKRQSVLEPSTTEERQEIFSSSLQKSGSISRGISVGNRQDVFVNSNLNLQLEGNLTDDVSLSAVISDQNVPFQPEGNTQQLQQFDRIQIQLRHNNATLSAGDVVFQQSRNSHFLHFYKNVLGGMLEGRYGSDSIFLARAKLGLAAAKGQFQSYQLPVQEGVQGPYRLVGANNERFIIIQAGSERIFIDGQLLQRGFTYDYIIDYNTAEITFNPHVVITQFSVVRVEFEYTNQFYNRSIQNIGANVNFLKITPKNREQRFQIFAEHYKERDNENQPINFDISADRQELLSNVGDSLELAVVVSAEEAETFSVNQILYTTKDTLIEGRLYQIFVRATPQDERFFTVAFSEVGQGNGDYALGQALANGREYRFVGLNQGNFAPLRQLPAPNSKQLTNFGFRFSPTSFTSYFAEGAFSKKDLNLFSDKDHQDDNGNAFLVGFETKEKPFLHQQKWKLTYGVQAEQLNRFFQPIDRFRAVDFDRDWTLPNFFTALPQGEDRIFQTSTSIIKDNQNKIAYQFAYRHRANTIEGTQHKLELSKRIAHFEFSSKSFLLNGANHVRFQSVQDIVSKPTFLTSPQTVKWLRLNSDIKFRNRWLIPAYAFSLDKQQYSRLDSVTATLMNFEEHRFYLLQGDSSQKATYRFDYALRNDFLPQQGRLKHYTSAQTIKAEGNTNFDTQKLAWNATYRKITYQEAFLDSTNTLQSNENLMGRIDWRSEYVQHAIRQELTYTTATGREPAREFAYIQVDGTEGTHTWRDDNNDGIQQLNEFYEAINPDERNFIKLFIPTATYVNAFSTDFIYKLNLTPPRAWKKSNRFKKRLALFSAIFSIQNSIKTTENEFKKRFLPFANRNQEQILSEQTALRNVLFLNRTNPKWGGEFRYTTTRQKNLLANGFESKSNEELQAIGRMNLSKTTVFKFSMAIATNQNASDFLENRNYLIEQLRPQAELSWQPSSSFRISGSYRFEEKNNQLNLEKATVNELRTELRYSKVGKSIWNARFRYLKIAFEGEPNSPVGYELLEALRAGQNLTWDFNLQQKLFNGLQLSLVYEGRKSEQSAAVHIGRVQVTALF